MSPASKPRPTARPGVGPKGIVKRPSKTAAPHSQRSGGGLATQEEKAVEGSGEQEDFTKEIAEVDMDVEEEEEEPIRKDKGKGKAKEEGTFNQFVKGNQE